MSYNSKGKKVEERLRSCISSSGSARFDFAFDGGAKEKKKELGGRAGDSARKSTPKSDTCVLYYLSKTSTTFYYVLGETRTMQREEESEGVRKNLRKRKRILFIALGLFLSFFIIFRVRM